MTDRDKRDIEELVEAIESGDDMIEIPATMPEETTDTTAPEASLIYGLKPRVKSDGRTGR